MAIDDDSELVALDDDTFGRLELFASATGKTPAQAAAALLRDLLLDTDFWLSVGAEDGTIH